MSETVMYNEEVTAETLNNIAIDLGATTFSYFSDDSTYAVDELNRITADLIGKGVLLTGNKCRVEFHDGTIHVLDGVIVFENGAKIRVTENKSFEALPGTSYIYALNDVLNNTASLICSDTAPDETSDHVKLAEVTDGEVTQYYAVSASKVQLPCANNYQEINDEFTFRAFFSNSFVLRHSINTEIDTYNFIYCEGWQDSQKHEFKEIGKFDENGECVLDSAFTVDYKFKKLSGKIEIYTLYNYTDPSNQRICFEKIILA